MSDPRTARPAVVRLRNAKGRTAALILSACAAASALGGCVTNQTAQLPAAAIDPSERDCLLRAMYFESNRSSYDGLMAVGTVVMNRKETGRFGNTVCSVVGQPRQFAAGALTRKVSPRESMLAEKAADAVMSGERHPNMDYVMYFHTAGLHFPYRNMHYRLVAGGNAFYERYPRVPKQQDTMIASTDAAQQPGTAGVAPVPPPGVATVPAIASASSGPSFANAPAPQPVAVASAQPQPEMQQPQLAAAAGTSTVTASPQTQTTLAYAATPAQPAAEQASPLFNALASALSDRQRQQTAAVAQPAAQPVEGQPAAVQSADAPPTANAAEGAVQTQPSATASSADTSAPVPR